MNIAAARMRRAIRARRRSPTPEPVIDAPLVRPYVRFGVRHVLAEAANKDHHYASAEGVLIWWKRKHKRKRSRR
ncbi:hypothetical protein OG528_30590 [Streptomyces platensis]|uniref:hypothetical protein n=1 Tax=Streptomyces platensis TaxID=58346 RepID=UPI0030E454A9